MKRNLLRAAIVWLPFSCGSAVVTNEEKFVAISSRRNERNKFSD
jgi:hypothetical protein